MPSLPPHDGSRIYVVNRPGGALTVIDTATHSVIGSIPVGSDPVTVVASPDGTRLYVGVNPPGISGAAIRVINRTTGGLLGSIALGAPMTLALAMAPDGRRLYATGWTGTADGYSIKVVDTALGALVATIPVIKFPFRVAVSPSGGRVFVAHGTTGTGTITAINTATNSVITTFPVGVNPRGLAFPPGGDRLFVANNGVPFTVSIVNPVANTVIGSIPGAVHMSDIVFSADGGRAFAPHDTGVAIFDAVTSTMAGNIPLTAAVDGDPQQIALLPEPPEPPEPPADLFASAIAGNVVTLHWRAAATGTRPTSYLVEGGLGPGQVIGAVPTGSPLPTVTFTVPSGAFYVRVRALAAGVVGGPSNEIRIVVNVPLPPSAPAGLVGLVNGSSLDLAWRPSSEGGAPAAHVLEVTGSLAASLPLGPAETFAFAGVPTGIYTFTVRAANAFGTSPPSNPVTLTFPGSCSGPPSAPPGFHAYAAGAQLSLFWEPPPAGPAPQHFVLTVGGAYVGAFSLVGRNISASVGPGTYQLSLAAANACGIGPATPVQAIAVP